ncbi:anti-sigma factor family protein [Flavitalea sp.]|nr:hypothetical protein [Flavitalea sp.]
MNINRDNYEEFFVLYIDKELNPAERAAVENFVKQNPDLEREMEMLEQTILPLDEMETFGNKDVLFRKENEPVNELINELNCEEFFVLYADNELNNNQNALVEEFIYRHPQYQEHFELIQQVKFQPEKHIVFPDKSILYRSEHDNKVVPMFSRMRSWKMVAAAAVLLMIGGTLWYALDNTTGTGNDLSGVASNNQLPLKPTVIDSVKKPTEQQSTLTDNNAKERKEVLPATISTESRINKSPDLASTNGHDKKDASKPAKLNDAELKKLVENSGQSTEKAFAQTPSKKDNSKSNIISIPNVTQENAGTKIEGLKNESTNKNNGPKKDGSDKADGLNKNIDKGNNSIIVPEKPNKDEVMAMVEPENNNSKNKVAIGPVELKSDNVFTRMANENDEEFEQSNKKNKMRGIFRKVTRVFDKATNREPSENRRDVRIASFSIGLK